MSSNKKVKLYHFEASPPSRACLMLINFLQLEVEVEIVDLQRKANYKSDFAELNPTHKVPVLDDNGFILWDSHAILTYLAEKYASPSNHFIYPKNSVEKRAIIQQFLHFDNGLLFPRLASIVRPLFYTKFKEIAQDKLDDLNEAYRFLEKFLKDKEFLTGDQLTIADISVLSSVSSIAAVCPINALECPRLANWLEKCKQFPFYDVNKKGVEIFRKLI